MVKNGDVVGKGHDGVHHVFHHEKGDAFFPDLPQQNEGIIDFMGSQPGHDLIEQEQVSRWPGEPKRFGPAGLGATGFFTLAPIQSRTRSLRTGLGALT
jgi:hypothetical protein